MHYSRRPFKLTVYPNQSKPAKILFQIRSQTPLHPNWQDIPYSKSIVKPSLSSTGTAVRKHSFTSLPFNYPKNTPCGYLFNLSSLRCGTSSPPNRTFKNLNNRMGTASFCIFKPYITFQRQTSNLQSISCNHTTPISCWGLSLRSTYLPVSFSQKVHYSTISSSAFNSALQTSQKL